MGLLRTVHLSRRIAVQLGSGDGNSIVVPESKLNSISPLYPTSQIKVVGGQVIPNPDKKNYRPRLGVAYLLNDKTVVRGGYGMYTETLGNFAALQGTGPFQLSETFFNTVQNGQALFSFPNPFPAAPVRCRRKARADIRFKLRTA